jgi:hypothetical protein
MPKPKNQPETNVEFVNHGVQQLWPLAQLLVLEALRNRSGIIADTDSAKVNTPHAATAAREISSRRKSPAASAISTFVRR